MEIRVYNVNYPKPGAIELGKDSVRIQIPPIGEYVDKTVNGRKLEGKADLLAVQSIIANSQGTLSLNPPMAPITKEDVTLVDALQKKNADLMRELELLRQAAVTKVEETVTEPVEEKAEEPAPKAKAKKE